MTWPISGPGSAIPPRRSLAKNFLYNTALTISNLVFPLVVFMHVSRAIGPERLGRVNLAQTVANYFVLFGLFGMTSYGTREIARVRDNADALRRTFNELFRTTVITMGLVCVGYAALILGYPRFHAEVNLYCAAGLIIALSLFSFDWLFQGLENYRYIAVRSILIKVTSLILILVFVQKPADYVKYAFLFSLGAGANYLLNAFFVSRTIGFSGEGLDLKRHFPALFRFAAISMATSLYVGMDKLFLGFIAGESSVGLYAPAERIVRLALSFVMAASSVLLPRAANLYASGDGDRFQEHVSLSLHAVFILALPFFLALEILSSPLVTFFSGQAYAAAATTLKIEAAMILPVTLANILGVQVLVGTGREAKYLFSNLLAATAFAAMATVLVPRFAQDGAAWSIVVAETTGAAVQTAFTWRYLVSALRGTWGPKLLAAGALFGTSVYALSRTITNPTILLVVSVTAGGLVYFGALILMHDEIMGRILEGFFRKRRVD